MFTKETITILKNFSKINKNILFEQGNHLKTVAMDGSIHASVQLPFMIQQPAPISDLQRFLTALNLVGVDENLKMEFGEDSVLLNNNQKTVYYNYAIQDRLCLPEGNMSDVVDGVSFKMSTECLQYIISACTSFGLTDIQFKTEAGSLYVTMFNIKEPLENTFKYKLADNVPELSASLKFEGFTIAVDEYECVLNAEAGDEVLFMKGTAFGIKYWIACN